MAVLGSKGVGVKLSCGSGGGAVCVDDALRPVSVSQLDSVSGQRRGGRDEAAVHGHGEGGGEGAAEAKEGGRAAAVDSGRSGPDVD